MTTIETGQRELVRVGVSEIDPALLLGLDPNDVAEQAARVLRAYNQGDVAAFNAAFEKPPLDPEISEFSKKAHILFRQHVGIEGPTLGHDWLLQKLIGSTSLYGRAMFNSKGSIKTAQYKGYNWGDNVPTHLLKS